MPEKEETLNYGMYGVTSILVVDDNPTTHQVVRDSLKDYAVMIHSALDGYQGFLKISNLRSDIVVLDIQMPGMNGDQVLQKIREDDLKENTNTVVLMVTGDPSRDSVTTLGKLGIQAYILKPFDSKTFMMHLNKVFKLIPKDSGMRWTQPLPFAE